MHYPDPTRSDPLPEAARAAVDPMLGPATRLLWRSPTSVHLETGRRAVVVDGLPAEVVRLVASRAPVEDPPVLDADERSALTHLTDAGYLWPRVASPGPHSAPPVPRLARELTALAARHGTAAASVLALRRQACVVVDGAGGAAVHLAALLAAAGVGRVRCASGGSARLVHALPGGVTPHDEGRDLATAADDAVRRAAPDVDSAPLPHGTVPTLTVLATDVPVDDDRRAALHAARAAHLVMALAADHGSVGPLVLPGLTSCLRCADLHRRDRDPSWPALAVQLTVPPRLGQPTAVALAAVVAGIAAGQVLAFLDGADPAVLEGSLEAQVDDWRVRRRTRGPHPDCDCLGPEPAGVSLV